MAIVMMVLMIILTIMIMTTTIRLCGARVGAATGKKELSVVEKFPWGLLQVIVIITYDHDHTYGKDEGSDYDKLSVVENLPLRVLHVVLMLMLKLSMVQFFVGGLSHLLPSSLPEKQS